jgi:uncharacterized repeat protein (TIGR03803 family)
VTSLSSPAPSGSGYKVLYRFQGGDSKSDGSFPHSSLIAVKDRLYGTTVLGGNENYSACGGGKFFAGCGTIFEVTTSGKEGVLYAFAGGSDGFFPFAGLLRRNGTLYGTTQFGGGLPCKKYYHSCGTVFRVSLSGHERILHSFAGPPDGAEPSARLIAVNGALYGTTTAGGSMRDGCARYAGCGVVFQVEASGSERVVYAFKAGKDAAFPSGPLLSVHGTLYGTTSGGGSGRCGTVFKVSTSGNESIVHSFSGSGDGCYPTGDLATIDGALYGVTSYDAGNRCKCGAVFKLTTNGAEKIIYRFKGGTDGECCPYSGLIAFNGALYGTTGQGGSGCSASHGCGTVYRVTTAGAEHVLYAFQGGTDGAYPEAGLTTLGGTIYGTTAGGGGYSCGYGSSQSCGTVFAISP